jgi:hypothetical protein
VTKNVYDKLKELEQVMETMTKEEIGGLFLMYVKESAHQSFDGHPRRDISAYGNLFADMALTATACLKDDPDYFKKDFYFGPTANWKGTKT